MHEDKGQSYEDDDDNKDDDSWGNGMADDIKDRDNNSHTPNPFSRRWR